MLLPEDVGSTRFPVERRGDARNVIPVGRDRPVQRRIGQFPINPAVLTDAVIIVRMPVLKIRFERGGQEHTLGMFLKIGHDRAARVGELSMVGKRLRGIAVGSAGFAAKLAGRKNDDGAHGRFPRRWVEGRLRPNRFNLRHACLEVKTSKAKQVGDRRGSLTSPLPTCTIILVKQGRTAMFEVDADDPLPLYAQLEARFAR